MTVAALRRVENDAIGRERSAAGAVTLVQSVLEAAGIEFIEENGDGSGARLVEPEQR